MLWSSCWRTEMKHTRGDHTNSTHKGLTSIEKMCWERSYNTGTIHIVQVKIECSERLAIWGNTIMLSNHINLDSSKYVWFEEKSTDFKTATKLHQIIEQRDSQREFFSISFLLPCLLLISYTCSLDCVLNFSMSCVSLFFKQHYWEKKVFTLNCWKIQTLGSQEFRKTSLWLHKIKCFKFLVCCLFDGSGSTDHKIRQNKMFVFASQNYNVPVTAGKCIRHTNLRRQIPLVVIFGCCSWFQEHRQTNTTTTINNSNNHNNEMITPTVLHNVVIFICKLA